jgi:hypothetical protein
MKQVPRLMAWDIVPQLCHILTGNRSSHFKPLCLPFQHEDNDSHTSFHCSANKQVYVLKTLTQKGALIHCWWEWKPVQPLWKTIWRPLKNLNIDLPYDPAIPLLGIHQRNVTQVTPEAPAHPCLLRHYSQ